jgi:DtxR family Mn-dependent transcriptional regulator
MQLFLIVAIALPLAVLLYVLTRPSMPAGRLLRQRQRKAERAFWEDVLRQVLLMNQDQRPVSEEALAGALGRPVPAIRRVLLKMAEHGLFEGDLPHLRLSTAGQRWALHVLRAHRLWESYLADEAGLPMNRLHRQAELAEHRLSARDLEALDAHLGHPTEDPHGDPIPSPEGIVRPTEGKLLAHWEGGDRARVIHVEDEPSEIFQQLVAKGVLPGVHLQLVAARAEGLEVEVDGRPEFLPADLLANIDIDQEAPDWMRDPRVIRLSELETGTTGEVVALSDAIRGFSRRRLMDFGVTRGALVSPVLDNPFRDPRAFRVRGTMIGIRKEQADQIWVRPQEATA